MHLRTNIFLWVSLATVVPLTAIILLATGYSEHLHRTEVDRQVAANLNYLVAEFDRRLTYEREVVEALSVSPPMQRFRPVLESALNGQRHAEFDQRAEELASFLEELQSVLRDVGTIRVLDAQANTLIKVRFGTRTSSTFTGIDPYPYAEAELDDDFLLGELEALPEGEVGYLLLPPALNEYGDVGPAPMQDAAVPLVPGDSGPLGYLLVNSTGVQIDRILELSPRLYQGKLLIAELNQDLPERDGLMLYDEGFSLRFSSSKDQAVQLRQLFDGQLLEAVEAEPFGAFTAADGHTRIYYAEYLPYPNELDSWVIATRVDMDEITAPFTRIRLGILLFAAVALGLSLVLAQLGARSIAGPIVQLADKLKAYAQGLRLKQPLVRATKEIDDLHASFEYMADTLETARKDRDKAEKMLLQSAKLASIGEMAAGIGHEINNPLNNILCLAKLIHRSVPANEEDVKNDVHSLIEETNRASRIVRGILDFARQVPPQYGEIRAQAWVDDTIALVGQAAKDAGVDLRVKVDPELRLEGDANQLQQVLINLLLNAIQASKRGDEISIDARVAGANEAALSVSDQGSGIAPEIMEKLFDPFFTTKPIGKGSGLGLSVSLGIVEHHGGRILLDNNERGGVTATIVLPLHRYTLNT